MNPSPPKHRRSRLLWIIPLVAVILLLVLAKPGSDLYRRYRAAQSDEDAPTTTDAVQLLREIPGVKTGRFDRTFRFLISGQASPGVRVLLFVMTLGGIVLLAALILVYEYAFLAMTGGRRARFRPYVWLRRLVLGIAGAGVLCVFYGFFVEPY